MAKYKDLVGTAVTNFAGNNPGAVEGELWYDSSNYLWKYQYPNVTTAGAWATGASLNETKENLGGSGTQTAALAFAGNVPPLTANTESWNGVTWTEVNNMNAVRFAPAGAGTQTSTLAFGGGADPGLYLAITESWNGTNWTEVNDLNTGRYNCASSNSAPSTSMILFGGGPPNTGATEQWNGTNWTEVNDMNTARNALSGAGVYASAIGFAGNTGSYVGLTEEWNGSSWTEVADLSVASVYRGALGLASSALAIGSAIGPLAQVELWTGANVVQTRTFTDS